MQNPSKLHHPCTSSPPQPCSSMDGWLEPRVGNGHILLLPWPPQRNRCVRNAGTPFQWVVLLIASRYKSLRGSFLCPAAQRLTSPEGAQSKCTTPGRMRDWRWTKQFQRYSAWVGFGPNMIVCGQFQIKEKLETAACYGRLWWVLCAAVGATLLRKDLVPQRCLHTLPNTLYYQRILASMRAEANGAILLWTCFTPGESVYQLQPARGTFQHLGFS